MRIGVAERRGSQRNSFHLEDIRKNGKWLNTLVVVVLPWGLARHVPRRTGTPPRFLGNNVLPPIVPRMSPYLPELGRGVLRLLCPGQGWSIMRASVPCVDYEGNRPMDRMSLSRRIHFEHKRCETLGEWRFGGESRTCGNKTSPAQPSWILMSLALISSADLQDLQDVIRHNHHRQQMIGLC